MYIAIVFAVRFLQGVNWGFSEQMQHESLDKDILISLKVAFDIIQSVKQMFREHEATRQEAKLIDDCEAKFYSESTFLICSNWLMLDRIVTSQE